MNLTVTPNPLVAGGAAYVCIEGGAPGPATVDIDNGGDLSDTLPVALDPQGNGCANWTVPGGWGQAQFNHAECPEVVRHIVNPPEI